MSEHRVATRAASASATRYELERPLGQGGMAEVFLARAHTTGGFAKRVVIKRILPALAGDATIARMFLDEARIALALNHANIVQVFDVREQGGEFFYVMEFLDGCDVREITNRAAQRQAGSWIEQAVTIVHGVCGGLHYAHGLTGDDGQPLQIVHRDVSPQNIFVTRDGNVKIIDFGIAKAANRLSVTQSMLKGKFGYMSPEQCLNEPVDHRSDVFSAAIVLHELTSGARLFVGDSEYEVLKKLLELPIPRPSSFLPGYPAELERIVMKGLEREPAQRYQTARELGLDLERFAAGRGFVLTPTVLTQFMLELSSAVKTPEARPAHARSGDAETLSSTNVPVRLPKRSTVRPLLLSIAAALLLSVGGLAYWSFALRSVDVPVMARLPLPHIDALPSSPASAAPETESSIAPVQRPVVRRRSAVRSKTGRTQPPPLSEKAVLDAPLPK